jgi:alanyl-tRNA synthetase
MKSTEIRERYLKFFEKRGHKIVPSASLIPENDPSSLFTTAGMQPLVPYLLGQKHPAGIRIVNAQKCVRTGDIDDVGDNRHLTFFEMLGNWSLGDYFKNESINWSFEFLTSKTEGLGLDPKRLYVTTFKGENGIPRDEDSVSIWKKVFANNNLSDGVATDESIKEGIRIIPLGQEDNFWIAGATGPCGADTEIFYDVLGNEKAGAVLGNFADLVKDGRLIEIWNNVFMEFNKTADGKYSPLVQKNVDTGMGLERTTVVMQGKSNVFETDIFEPFISYIKNNSTRYDERIAKIVSDHIRSAVFIISDGVIPSNTDAGYVLRRIMRRLIRFADKLLLPENAIQTLADLVINNFASAYPTLGNNRESIFVELKNEEDKFRKTLHNGLKEFEKGIDPFILFSTYGFPIELTKELADEKGQKIDQEKFNEQLKKHQEISKIGSDQKFKGGLGGTGEKEIRYHTATHLLHQALRDVLGNSVAQKGSNITAERLRFDFVHSSKMTDEEKKKVEAIVNEKIAQALPVTKLVMPKAEAEKTGALHFFGDKYGDEVSVYFIGENLDSAYSKEFCGGPHVSNTKELGHFKIAKEEAVSAGVRRIKAILE